MIKIDFKCFCLFVFLSLVFLKEEISFAQDKINAKIEPLSVAWEGSFLDLGSLSLVNQNLILELKKKSELQLTCVVKEEISSTIFSPNHPSFIWLRDCLNIVESKSPSNIHVTVRHAWPPNWEAPKTGKWVLIQPWEYGSIPLDWVENIKKVDEVWVPTHFVKQEFVDSGVPESKVVVIPNGIDPLKFNTNVKPFPLKTDKKFKFLFLGGTVYRKGPDVLLNSYLRAFTQFDDVCLVIKDVGVNAAYAGLTYDKTFKAVQDNPHAPEIIYLNDNLTAEQIASIYKSCDCLVYPYRGEGFALPVLEAMACGLPVLVTKGGATDDFVTNAYGWFIPSYKKSIGFHLCGYTLAKEGWLLEPDAEALIMQMRWIANHPEIAKAKGEAASQYVHTHWTWQKAADLALKRLHSLAQTINQK